MARSIIDLIMHPVRIRILMLLNQQTTRTAAELHTLLPDVSRRSLYRHLEELVEGDMLKVAEKRQVRGTVEHSYCLVRPPLLTDDEKQRASADDWERFFALIMNMLSAEFSASVRSQDELNPHMHASSMRIGEIVATPEQVHTLIEQMITQASATTMIPADGERARYRIGLFAFPLEPTKGEEL